MDGELARHVAVLQTVGVIPATPGALPAHASVVFSPGMHRPTGKTSTVLGSAGVAGHVITVGAYICRTAPYCGSTKLPSTHACAEYVGGTVSVGVQGCSARGKTMDGPVQSPVVYVICVMSLHEYVDELRGVIE